jgi:hypothetical protein
MTPAKVIAHKLKTDELGHFYHITPSKSTDNSEFLKSWLLEILANAMSDEKKSFNHESILNHEDLLIIKSEEQKNYKLVDFNDFFSFLNYNASRFNRKIIVIENAEKLGVAVSNKLLKSLEEPPVKSTIFLLNDQKISLLETVKSRAISIRVPNLANVEDSTLAFDYVNKIKDGLSFDQFVVDFKGNKDLENELFTSLLNFSVRNINDAKLLEKIDAAAQQTFEDHEFNNAPLNRLHKIYFALKEYIDG